MLKFKKLSMENFGPYRSLEVLDFPDEGVVIVRGRNGRGKTSILNALRFVLFGIVKKNGRNIIPLSAFVNKIGIENGKYDYKVALNVNIDDDEFEITRLYSPKQGIEKPSKENDYQNPILTIRNITSNSVLTPDESTLFLSQIMTDPVSRFYLFDGELLKEYESQLSEDDENSAKQIRGGIEKILGVPILRNAKFHIDLKYKEAETEYNRVLSTDKHTNELGNARILAEKHRDEFDKQYTQLSEKYEQISNELAVKITQLNKHSLDGKLLSDKANCESHLNLLREKIKDKEEDRKIDLQNAWKGLLLPNLLKYKSSVDNEIKEIESNVIKIEAQNELINKLQSSIYNSRCELCNQPLDSEAKSRLESLLDECNNDTTINNQNIDKERLKHIKNHSDYINKLNNNGIISTSINNIHKLDTEIMNIKRDIVLEKTKLDEAINRLNEIGGISNEDYSKLLDDINRLNRQKDTTKDGIDSAKKGRDKKNETIKDIDNRLKDIVKTGNIEYVRKKKEYLEKFKDLFDDSILCYQDELRKNVEKDATELFLKLSSEKEYAGLRINENYGLDIVNFDNEIIPLRSSGYEHLVAFSLIGALHKNAPMRGPLFMDTSFGRLDRDNSENLIRVLPDLSEQVIILVHDREINEDSISRLIPNDIKARYGIERINSRESHLKLEGEI